MSDDIVTRLRDYRSHRIYMRYPDRDGTLPERVDWNLTGAEPNTLMVEAAAEIELLRSTVTDCRIEIERLTAERDEARRELCNMKCRAIIEQFSDANTAPQLIAINRGWDCFKEHP